MTKTPTLNESLIMKSLSYIFALLVLLATFSVRSSEPERLIPGCPLRLPLLATEQVSVSWTYDPTQKTYAYRYTLSNPTSSSDFINAFWIAGVRAEFSESTAPAHWLPMPDKASVMWVPTAPYTGPARSFMSAVVPSDADIAPGQTQSGFGITTARLPTLVTYKILTRRVIEDSPALTTVDNPSNAEEMESVAEANIERCGALHGDVTEFFRYGVTVGPGTIPAPMQSGLTFRPSTARPGSFELTLPLPSAAALAAPIDAVWFYSFEKGQQTVRVGAADITITAGLIKLTAPPALLDLYTCRTTAALVEFRAGKVPVLRSSLSAQQLGLPVSCM